MKLTEYYGALLAMQVMKRLEDVVNIKSHILIDPCSAQLLNISYVDTTTGTAMLSSENVNITALILDGLLHIQQMIFR